MSLRRIPFKKERTSDKVTLISFYVIIIFFSLICIYPFYQVLISSFADEVTLIREGYKIIPSQFSLDAYRTLFGSSEIMASYGLTISITLVGTIVQVIITAMAAYALSGTKLKYRNFFNLLYFITMLFSGGLIPYYILITNYLHLTDNLLVYIIPFAFNVWNMFLLRNFFSEIPNDLIESAKLDGANELQIAFKVVIPISLPAIATVSLFTALAFWNEWMTSQLYINDSQFYTLQYLIVKMVNNVSAASNLGQSGLAPGMITVPANTLRLATSIITVGPIIFLYPFLQKYFVAGLRVGAIKG
ncbi:MAG: carbohydrate ABC transporter permease [Acholeplasmatales bacterium]|nr:carbohydrate ABC transporter permease [Acholeplasmatales bacterium]